MRSSTFIVAAFAAKAFAGPVAGPVAAPDGDIIVPAAQLFVRQATTPDSTATTTSPSLSSTTTKRTTTTTEKTTTTTKKKTTTTTKKTTTKKTTTKTTTSKVGSATATTYQQAVVNHHNYHRANHSAPNIVWSAKMASFAKGIAQSCKYEHNVAYGGGGYGQNIAAGAPLQDISNIITDQFYNNEVNYYKKLYGLNKPDMTNFHLWGHFSQVVWRDTKSVGCYTMDCSKKSGGLKGITGKYSNIAPLFTVCNYDPPGNYGGEYKKVGHTRNQKTVNGNYRVQKSSLKQINPPAASNYT